MSTVKRILPFDALKTAAVVTAAAEETARFEVTSENTCPTCGQAMVIGSANGHQAWICERDRHCFPIKDIK